MSKPILLPNSLQNERTEKYKVEKAHYRWGGRRPSKPKLSRMAQIHNSMKCSSEVFNKGAEISKEQQKHSLKFVLKLKQTYSLPVVNMTWNKVLHFIWKKAKKRDKGKCWELEMKANFISKTNNDYFALHLFVYTPTSHNIKAADRWNKTLSKASTLF